jgi:hypothetical protein
MICAIYNLYEVAVANRVAIMAKILSVIHKLHMKLDDII